MNSSQVLARTENKEVKNTLMLFGKAPVCFVMGKSSRMTKTNLVRSGGTDDMTCQPPSEST